MGGFSAPPPPPPAPPPPPPPPPKITPKVQKASEVTGKTETRATTAVTERRAPRKTTPSLISLDDSSSPSILGK